MLSKVGASLQWWSPKADSEGLAAGGAAAAAAAALIGCLLQVYRIFVPARLKAFKSASSLTGRRYKCVGSTGSMAMLCTTERQIEKNMEEGETRDASRCKRKYRNKQHQSQRCPTSDPSPKSIFCSHNKTTSQCPVGSWSFRAGVLLNWGLSFLFPFSRGLRRPL